MFEKVDRSQYYFLDIVFENSNGEKFIIFHAGNTTYIMKIDNDLYNAFHILDSIRFRKKKIDISFFIYNFEQIKIHIL